MTGFHLGDDIDMTDTNNIGKVVNGPSGPPTSEPSPSPVVWRDPLVFINYRSADERPARDIETEFIHQLGRGAIFRDVTMIAGTEFPRELLNKAASCPVMLSIIGEKWDDPNGLSLLHDPTDWVHREIGVALNNNVTVIPVLIGTRGRLSAEDLPSDIRQVAYLQAPHLSRDYEPYDVRRLVTKLMKVRALATARDID